MAGTGDRRPRGVVTAGATLFLTGLLLLGAIVASSLTGRDVPPGAGLVCTLLFGSGFGLALLGLVLDGRGRRR